ncbi:hypothetical protein [Olivibacter domesticus]|uniref:Uncharacterized protein n=2 Tax=Olivibacter domesticus TaxID=407022 RepID=A0A1H7KI52_OLID1|nr:hypothetical protein SAMN05661044_01362 [Olivibacter domesticus]
MQKRYLSLFFATSHLALILLYNVHSILSAHGYRLLEPCFRAIEKFPITRQYLIWSGTETVYGFFAPTVGSQQVLLFHSKEDGSNSSEFIDYPLFNTSEAKFRYISFLDQLEDKLRSKDPRIQAYGRALLKGLVNRYRRNPGAVPIESLSIYVVIQPRLAAPATQNIYKKIYHLSM